MGFIQTYIAGRISKMTAEELQPLIIGKLDALPKVEKTDMVYVNRADNIVSNKITAGSSKERQIYEADPAAYVHRHEVISGHHFFIGDPIDRIYVAKYCAWVEAGVFKVADYLTMESPLFATPDTAEDEEPQPDDKITRWWKENLGDRILRRVIEKSRMHGWVLYIPFRNKLPEWYNAPKCHIFSADEVIQGEHKFGYPVEFSIHPSNEFITEYTRPIMIEQCIFFDVNWSDDFRGIPDIIPLWDDAIDYLFIQDAVNAFDQRMGNGFLTIVVPGDTDNTDIIKIEEKIKNVRTEMGLVVRGAVNEPVVIDWMKMGGAQVDFINHMAKIEDRMAMALRFPKRWLLGDQEGAMESSGKDMMAVNVQLKALFKLYIPFIESMLLFHGVIKDRSEVAILPPFKMQLSEQEKLELENLKAQTIAMKSGWLSVNEMRELDGYAAKEGGDEVGALRQAQNEEEQQQEPEPAEEQKTDSFSQLRELFTKVSVRDMAALTGVSPTTVSKVRDFMDAHRIPIAKTDSICEKADSYQINGDIWEIPDALVVPAQAKYYDKLGYTAVRSLEEIQRSYESPTTPKEYKIGVLPDGAHEGSVEITDSAIGTVKLTHLDSDGIHAAIQYDLALADKILGKDNWLRKATEKSDFKPTSVALTSVDLPMDKDRKKETDIDIRSFIFTEFPRNENAGGV